MRKLITCSLLNDTCKQGESVDSPMQLKLINYLGVKKYMIEKFIFRRKQPGYALRKKQGKNTLYLQQQYEPPQGYTFDTFLLQTASNSIPICKLTPKEKTNNNVVVYAHGNSSDMSNSLLFIQGMCEHISTTYVIFDYSGYGESRVPDVGEEVICRDMDIVLAWITEFANLKDIILWGFSLGTYPVTYAASKYELGGVILQCPIASISCIFYEELHPNMQFENDHFANLELIQKVKSKILILHSSGDEILPIAHAKILFDKFVQTNGDDLINFIEVAKIGHNSLHKYIITRFPNALQTEVFHFLLEIIYKTGHPVKKHPKKSEKTKKQGIARKMSQRTVDNTRVKLSELRGSKVSAEQENTNRTTISDLTTEQKMLEELRMQILQAELEEIEEDMQEIVVEQINGKIQEKRNKNDERWRNKCLCLTGQNQE